MERLRVSEIFRKGVVYDVITKYKEIPVKARFRLNWTDDEGRLLGFGWGKTHLRAAFSTLDPVYVKVDSNEYAQTQVFSNLGKELVLMVENFVGPPEFVRRRSVRVVPDENRPVLLEANLGDVKLKVHACDVSETGIGAVLSTKGNERLLELLQRGLEEVKEGQALELTVRLHLPGGCTASGKGKLRNIVGLSGGHCVRLGFEIELPREELNKVRRYVIERQKEIVKSLRMVE
jgi:hypothetical protein